MTPGRLLLGWLLVLGWTVTWELLASRLAKRPRTRDDALRIALLDASLYTLVGGLWFWSLGRGGWPLIFAGIGALSETRARVEAGGWRVTATGVLGGVVRGIGTGGLLRWAM